MKTICLELFRIKEVVSIKVGMTLSNFNDLKKITVAIILSAKDFLILKGETQKIGREKITKVSMTLLGSSRNQTSFNFDGQYF